MSITLYIEEHPQYRTLFQAAAAVLRLNYHPVRHTVGAAVACVSGNIYTGINVGSSGIGVCAEAVALGTALSRHEMGIAAVIAVCDRGDDEGLIVLSPCGNCRQLILDYAPNAEIIYSDGGRVVSKAIRHLMPGAYIAPDMVEH